MSSNGNNGVWIGIGFIFFPGDSEYSDLLDLNAFLTSQYGNTYSFDEKTRLPHVNLYDFDLPKENLKKVEERLEKIASKFKKFELNVKGTNFFSFGLIYIACELDNLLKDLEGEVVKSVCSLRQGCITKEYWEPQRNYTSEEIENRDKYGNPYVLNTFTPHVTVGLVRESKDKLESIVSEVDKIRKFTSLKCKSLDLVVHDKDGKLIYSKRFELN